MKLKAKDTTKHFIELARQAIADSEYHYEEDHIVKDSVLQMKWMIGGVSGGSCWDSSDPQPFYNDYSPKRFASLETLLEMVCPTISFLVFRELTTKLVEEDSEYEQEYYGNCTDYTIHKIDLSELLEFLMEEELIEIE